MERRERFLDHGWLESQKARVISGADFSPPVFHACTYISERGGLAAQLESLNQRFYRPLFSLTPINALQLL